MDERAPCRQSPSPTRSTRTLPTVLAGLLLVGALAPAWIALADGQSTADVSKIFGSWDEWERAYGELESAIDDFEGLTDEPVETAARLVVVMEARDRVFRTARGVEDYIYLLLQLNGNDEEARSREHLLDETDRKWYTTGSPWFTNVVTDLGQEKIDGWMVGEETLRRYDFFFRRFFGLAGHPYPEGQDELRTLSSVFGQQSARVYNALAISEAPVIEVTLESGERIELNSGRSRTILEELSSPVDRRTVSQAWLEALGRQSQTYAALLEGIVKRQKLLAQVREFDSALSAQLYADAIPADAVRNVIRVAREASAPLRRYHSLRKRVLGLDEYGLADRFVPLDQSGREIGFDEAERLIVESSSTLGPEVQDLVRRAFSAGWIDSIERPGKRAHGGATFVAGHPYVLVNYRGSLETLFQLAHEIGHAVHSYIAYHAQPFVYSHPSSLTGESVAAVFEGALVEQMVEETPNQQEKIRVLDLSIQNILRLFYRPMLDADFELRLYETDGPITGPSLEALYLAVVSDFYGETVSLNDWDAHSWQQTPHYYTSPLYMGKYGLSTAAANSLIAQLESPVDTQAASARRALLNLMRSGSSGYPIELLGLAGVDLANSHTIEVLVARLDSLVDELERAVNGN